MRTPLEKAVVESRLVLSFNGEPPEEGSKVVTLAEQFESVAHPNQCTTRLIGLGRFGFHPYNVGSSPT